MRGNIRQRRNGHPQVDGTHVPPPWVVQSSGCDERLEDEIDVVVARLERLLDTVHDPKTWCLLLGSFGAELTGETDPRAMRAAEEALGLARAPKVEISQRAVHFQGPPGVALEHVLLVQTAENRPVYAHATTGIPWLIIGRKVLDGRTARIPLKVPEVPARPGQTLTGKVQVIANGNQRFLVEVSLAADRQAFQAAA